MRYSAFFLSQIQQSFSLEHFQAEMGKNFSYQYDFKQIFYLELYTNLKIFNLKMLMLQ